MNRTYESLYTDAVHRELAEQGMGVPTKESMTCYGCPQEHTCEFAWDLYNTDGECLAGK